MCILISVTSRPGETFSEICGRSLLAEFSDRHWRMAVSGYNSSIAGSTKTSAVRKAQSLSASQAI